MDPEALEKMIPKEIAGVPDCPKFTCEDNEVAVQAFDPENHHVQHYGCDISKILKDVGLDELNQYSMGMLKQPKIQACCAKAAICYASCGNTMQECHEKYELCTKAAAKNANMAFAPVKLVSGFLKDFPAKLNKGESFAEARCKNYEALQNKHCRCVPAAERGEAIEEAVKAIYEKVNQADEVSGDKDDLESPFNKKMGPIREKWIQENNEKDLFEKLFTKFQGRILRQNKRPAIKIGDIPGVAQMVKHPYVKTATSMMGVDLKDFGIDIDEDDAEENDDEDEEEGAKDDEL